MPEQIRKEPQVEAWKSLVSLLPGILGVEFNLAGGEIREVHVLSDQSRTAKQIARDVQSALMARFQLELDHRLISVAQIPGSLWETPRHRLVCERLSVSSGRSGGRVAVVLRLDEQEYVGESVCDLSGASRVRGVAQATVEALNRLLTPSSGITLQDVRRVPLDENVAILVGVQLRVGAHIEHLLGACYEGEDPNLSVVCAALDAINRRFLTLDLSETPEA